MIILARLLIFSFNIELDVVSINATVRLSWTPPAAKPCSSTRMTRLSTAPPGDFVPAAIFISSFSVMFPQIPSVHNIKRSPFSYASSVISTSTSGDTPNALVITFDCAESLACSSVKVPFLTSSETTEWSVVLSESLGTYRSGCRRHERGSRHSH